MDRGARGAGGRGGYRPRPNGDNRGGYGGGYRGGYGGGGNRGSYGGGDNRGPRHDSRGGYNQPRFNRENNENVDPRGGARGRGGPPRFPNAGGSRPQGGKPLQGSGNLMSSKLALPPIKPQKSVSENSLSLVPRPDSGNKEDTEVQVVTNCWDLSFNCLKVQMYNVEIVSAVVDRGDKKVDIRVTIKEKKQYIKTMSNRFGKYCVDDGGAIIYSLEEFPGSSKQSQKQTMIIKDESDQEVSVTYNIVHAATLSLEALLEFVKGGRYSSTLNMPQDAIRVLDTFFRFISSEDLVNTRHNNFFFKTPVTSNYSNLYGIYRGFSTSIRPQWKVRLNVDMICKAFFLEGKVSDVLYSKYNDRMYNPMEWRNMERDIRGVRVTASHFLTDDGKKFSRRFTCAGLSPKSCDETMIPDLNQSVTQYFKKHYKINLEYGTLPCVKVSKVKDTYMPMELLDIVPYQEPTCSAADIASQVVRSAAIKPIERFKELDRFVSRIVHNFKKEKVANFDFNLSNSKVESVGRVLPSPVFGQGGMNISKGGWKQDYFESPAMSGRTIKWSIFTVGNSPMVNKHVSKIKDEMISTGRQFRMQFDSRVNVRSVNRTNIQRELENEKRASTNIVICVLYDKFVYGEIKRTCDLHQGIVTQCIASTTVDKRFVFGNILLKVNGKLGGKNWTVSSMNPETDSEHIMVLGMDVTHPSPQQRSIEKSVYAIVGSVSSDLMRYECVVGQQSTSMKGSNSIVEVITQLETGVMELININAKANNRLPTRLIFYRDGVSEGQFKDVLLKELKAVQRACNKINPDYMPAITYVVVQKRHNIRFMAKGSQENVAPGTVVDTEITHPNEFDFYLCSHYGLQGTSKPAHYYVLYDDSDWKSAALQRFTYSLCHGYMRCSKIVSIPAPTYYSHLAAFRAREWIKGVNRVDNLLEDNKFKLHKTKEGWMFFL